MKSNHKNDIATYFSRYNKYWRDVYGKRNEKISSFSMLAVRNRRKYVIKCIKEQTKANKIRVLDCGCGSGGILKSMLDQGYESFGLDISMAMLRNTKQMSKEYLAEGAPCFQGDVEHIPFTDNSFDVALSIGVLQYLKEDETAMDELARVVKPGGLIIISAPNIARVTTILDPYYYFYRGPKYLLSKMIHKSKMSSTSRAQKDFRKNRDFSNRQYFYNKLKNKFKQAHLAIVETYAIGFGPLSFWQKDLLPFSWAMRISNGIENWVNKRNTHILKKFASRWVFCLKKEE